MIGLLVIEELGIKEPVSRNAERQALADAASELTGVTSAQALWIRASIRPKRLLAELVLHH